MSKPTLRFEVFKQDKPGQPHQNVGSVHAFDAELALLNARDVFSRRPSCYSLWVVPERAIYAVTAEALGSDEMQQALAIARQTQNDQPLQRFLVFQKTSQRQAMTFVAYVGEVEAHSLRQALALAVDHFGSSNAFVWWICAAAACTQSDPEIVESWFAPNGEKIYRQQSYYGGVARQRRDERERIAQTLSRPQEEETL